MNKVWDELPADLKDNPFFRFSEKTNYVPAWDVIRPEHFIPAMDYALEIMKRQAQAIADNKNPPNFTNTIEALETCGELAGYFRNIISNLPPGTGEAAEEYDRVTKEMYEHSSAAYHEIYGQNKKLLERVKAVAKLPSAKTLPTSKKLLLESTENAFVDEGIKISAKKKAAMQEMDKRISELEIAAQTNMKLAMESFEVIIDDKARLGGLSEFLIEAAAQKAAASGHPGKWAFDLSDDLYTPVMQNAQDRDLRRQLWQGFATQNAGGPYDNRAIALELIRLQQQKARMLGYRHTAAMNISYTMAEKTTRVQKFLTELRKAAMPTARRELKELKAFARKRDHIKLEPWDWQYYQERLKKDVLGFDEEQLRPYLELENTLKGVLRHYEKFLGLRFEETKDYPVYHPDVRAFNVYKKESGKLAGVVFMDLFARDGKTPGVAWDDSVLPQGLFEGKVRRPVETLVTKFTKGEPTLLQHGDLLVLLHEIGHAAHNLLSECRYPSQSGFNVDGDFVEFPSQFQENFGYQPSVLDDIAVHYKTGEKISDELKQKIFDSQKFMAGTYVLDRAKLGWIDLSWYRADPDRLTSIEAFEKAATAPFQLMPRHDALNVPGNSYMHGGGYEANYYSYQWSQIMEADIFAAFAEKGLYNRSLIAAYKDILEAGGSEWPAKLFRNFRHRNPLQKHFRARAGLLDDFNYAADPAAVPAPAPDAAPETPSVAVIGLDGAFAAGGGNSPAVPAGSIQSVANENNRAEASIDDIFAAPRSPHRGRARSSGHGTGHRHHYIP